MSLRSVEPTPLTSPTASTFRTPGLLSPTSTFDAGSSRRYGWKSQPLPLHSGGARRPSHLVSATAGMRKDSSASISASVSVSGTSTPDYAKRAKRMQAKGIVLQPGEKDWAGIEPDEIFRRLPVQEVRKVEAKMRGEAFHKQAELRSMVGTRYRDLLTSATQITTLHSSSQRLSDGLKKLSRDCRNPDDVAVTADNSAEDSEAEEVINMLPVAAHMKLLLDAPEALYGYLSRSSFLDAAFLWLVARVVKEGLTNMSEDAKEPYIPLLEKQWEILLPFRGQIVSRATTALKARETLEPKILSESLLAIILLDNLPLPDALALLLSQRTKALQEILSHSTDLTNDKSTLSPSRRKRSASSAKRGPPEREITSRTLIEAAECVLDTVSAATTVFEKKQSGEKIEDSLMESIIRLVQMGESLPVVTSVAPPTPARRTSHERRTSRLLSLSLPTPPTIPHASGPPISSTRVLQNLPSSQIYLRHLPPSILSFTPFITPSKLPSLSDSLTTWQSSSIKLLVDALPRWLVDLNSVSDIWQVRASLNSLLADGPLHTAIREALEPKWSERITSVWETKLASLLESTESLVRQAAEDIRITPSGVDVNPSSYLFSDLAFPNTFSSGLTAPPTSFHSFVGELKRRGALRTPKLEEVLLALEKTAAGIRKDSKGLPKSLYETYGKLVRTHLERTIAALRGVLKHFGDGKDNLEAEMFVGRVALFLAKQSKFIADLTGDAKLSLDDTERALLELHAQSTVRWQSVTIDKAITCLSPLFDPLRGPSAVKATWQGPAPVSPSPPIVMSLHSLVASVKTLGIPPGVVLSIVSDMLKAFVAKTTELEGWKSMQAESAVQAAVDLGFLNLVESGTSNGEAVKSLLAKAGPACPPDFAASLPMILQDNLRRMQLILSPLLAHLDPSILGAPATPSLESRTATGLLRFGPPTAKGGVGVEFRSPIAVAKPGKRFNLLSIAT